MDFSVSHPNGTITRTEERHSPETVQNVSQAMIMASMAMRRGASDAQLSAENLAQHVRQTLSSSIYTTCYYVSFGVVFPTMFLVRLLPLDNAFGHGLIDGASAAKEAVEGLQHRRKVRRLHQAFSSE